MLVPIALVPCPLKVAVTGGLGDWRGEGRPEARDDMIGGILDDKPGKAFGITAYLYQPRSSKC